MYIFLHTILPAVYSIVGIIGFIAAGIVAFGWIKKAQVDGANTTIDLQSKQIAAQTTQIESLKQACQLLEKRLYRVEVNDQKRTRLLKVARTEVQMLNEVVRVAVEALTRVNAEERKHVEKLLTELNAYRIKSSAEQEDWEEGQEVALAYINREYDQRIVPSIFTDPLDKGSGT